MHIHILSIHSSANKHLSCVCFLAIMNNAAKHILYKFFSVAVLISLGFYLGVELVHIFNILNN